MALSNIFREPRREITESAVGIGAFMGFLWLDYRFAIWFYDITDAQWPHNGCPWPLGMLFGVIAFGLLTLLAFMTHAMGESICDALARRGLELRPKQRY